MPSLLVAAAALFLLPLAVSADSLDCKHIRVDGQSFHFEKLGGPKTVHLLERYPPNIRNTSFTIDICAPLEIDDKIPKEDRCDHGTRICAIEREYRAGQEPYLSRVIPIAGDYTTRHGLTLDPKYTRLNGSESHADAGLEGVRVELHGGIYSGRKQRAIIEFICDQEKEGTEGFDETGARSIHQRRDDDNDDSDEGDGDDSEPELPKPDEGKALQFESYKAERDGKEDTLRLTWRTKYACEGQKSDEPDDDNGGGAKKSTGWGFFTWVFIVAFLLAATYIIFGSWLNYNRYGARGWDLVPHGDTIRDFPYLVKDWFGGLSERFTGGGGSRGGYSAV